MHASDYIKSFESLPTLFTFKGLTEKLPFYRGADLHTRRAFDSQRYVDTKLPTQYRFVSLFVDDTNRGEIGRLGQRKDR